MTHASRKPVHFLLVDDLPENLLALDGLLRRDGLVLLQARSGTEALELLLQYDVALALVDVQMPGMNGFELAELMRGTERTRCVPIIFLTAGSADRQRKFRGYEAGAVDFLQKPIEPDILRSKAEIFFELYRQREEVARQRDELETLLSENTRLLTESRKYAEALQEADRRKDDFLAMLAHELRNPLAPIVSAVNLLQLLDDLPTEVVEVRDVIQRQASHMVRLINDLLDVSRITRDKIELQLERVKLQDIVYSAVETSRPLLEGKRHSLHLDLTSEPLEVNGDAVRLTQVLANLLNNAAKYTPERGRIVVALAADFPWAIIRVTDNGLGIPAEKLTTIFDMFSQVSEHRDQAQGGLGIGLTLVKRLVEMHSGEIGVKSRGPLQGSEFSVRLPLVEQVNSR